MLVLLFAHDTSWFFVSTSPVPQMKSSTKLLSYTLSYFSGSFNHTPNPLPTPCQSIPLSRLRHPIPHKRHIIPASKTQSPRLHYLVNENIHHIAIAPDYTLYMQLRHNLRNLLFSLGMYIKSALECYSTQVVAADIRYYYAHCYLMLLAIYHDTAEYGNAEANS